jgi:hypothetical protein
VLDELGWNEIQNGPGDDNGLGEFGALGCLQLGSRCGLNTFPLLSRHHSASMFPIATATSGKFDFGWSSQQRRHHAQADEEHQQS